MVYISCIFSHSGRQPRLAAKVEKPKSRQNYESHCQGGGCARAAGRIRISFLLANCDCLQNRLEVSVTISRLELINLPTPRIQPHPTSQMTTKCQKCRKCKNTNAKCQNGRIPKCQIPKCQSKLPNVKKIKSHNANAKQCQNARDQLCSRSLWS